MLGRSLWVPTSIPSFLQLPLSATTMPGKSIPRNCSMSFPFLRTAVFAAVLWPGVSASADILKPNTVREDASVDRLPSDAVSLNPTPDSNLDSPTADSDDSGTDIPWTYQWLPDGLIYRSYLAGVKEPRFSLVQSHVDDRGRTWDATLGGRVAIFRYGTSNAYRPEGWEIDLEGVLSHDCSQRNRARRSTHATTESDSRSPMAWAAGSTKQDIPIPAPILATNLCFAILTSSELTTCATLGCSVSVTFIRRMCGSSLSTIMRL